MRGELTPAQIAGFVIGLRVKKETIGEIAAAAQVMREFATMVKVTDARHLVDTCGTGGDAAHTFNVSTASAFVAAAAGARVAKHMGRSVSSASGSAEVLEALGANIALTPEQIQVRVLQRLGSKHVMIVYGLEGLDEISISGETMIGELVNGEINEYTIHPQQFGIELYDRRAIQVNTVDESKQMILAVLEGQPGPALNIVLLNAGAAIYVAGVAASVQAGIDRARRAIAKGEARAKLDEFVAFTRQAAAKG
jgi:anthranilate phosphoribosyltransferase